MCITNKLCRVSLFKWLSYSESNILRYSIYRTARILASEPRDKQAIKDLEKEIAKIYQRNASFFNSSFGVLTQQEFVKSQTEPFKNDARLLAAIAITRKNICRVFAVQSLLLMQKTTTCLIISNTKKE